MKDRMIIQKYVNDFRRYIFPRLRHGIGVSCVIYPVQKEGAILEFKLGVAIKNNDEFKSNQLTIPEALKKIKQNAFGGNLSGFHFSGTNYILEPERIILIKGGDSSEYWSDTAARTDVNKILHSANGG